MTASDAKTLARCLLNDDPNQSRPTRGQEIGDCLTTLPIETDCDGIHKLTAT